MLTMARAIRLIEKLEPDARERVVNYLSARSWAKTIPAPAPGQLGLKAAE